MSERDTRAAGASPAPLLPSRWRSAGEMALLYVASLGGALLLSGLLVAVTGNSWTRVFGALMDGAFLADGRWGSTLEVAAPMLLVALGMVIGSKAGFFNIGQEGQLLMGALAMAWVATRLGGPGPLMIPFGLLMGLAFGGMFAGIAGLMRLRRGVPEVISTLLLTFVALQIGGFAVTTKWLLRDPEVTAGQQSVTSPQLPPHIRLPEIRIFGNEFNIGIVIAVVIAAVVAFALVRTVWGFRLRLLGHNPLVAQKAGVAASRTGMAALFLSGGLAGLAGAAMVTGGFSGYRVGTNFTQNIGWQGLLVALLARSNPVIAVPMALLFAALRTGSGFLAATGVDRKIVDVVQALLVLALLIPPAIQFIRDRRRALAMAGEEA